jgi:nitronate monooxygenase
MSASRPVFRTRLCEVLGIDYPILQSGMGGVAGPALAAEVSNAGGLGILAAALLPADQFRQGIGEIRAKTDRPFGVNLLLSHDLRPPAAATAIPEATVQAVQAALNPMRTALGLPATGARPAPPPDLVPENLQVVVEERVPVLSIGLGNPGPDLVTACHRRGIRVIAMVTTVEDARAVEVAGVDAVVAQGSEAGGHRSQFEKSAAAERGTIGTMALVPAVLDAVRLPVIAAGGLADGRGLVAALALGASGILMGTRFVATRESLAPEMYKKALLERSGDATTLTDAFSGRAARALRNAFSDAYTQAGAPVLPFFWQLFAASDIYQAAAAQENPEYFPMWAGQSVGLIHSLPSAAEVVELTIREARAVFMERMPQAVQLSE